MTVENSDALPVMEVQTVTQANGHSEVVLRIPDKGAGTYQSRIGLITIRELSLEADLRGKPSARGINPRSRAETPPKKIRSMGYGVPGCMGYITLDIGESEIAQVNSDANLRTIALHRKGLGSQQVTGRLRLWADMGQRIAGVTGLEQSTHRWRPVER